MLHNIFVVVLLEKYSEKCAIHFVTYPDTTVANYTLTVECYSCPQTGNLPGLLWSHRVRFEMRISW
jgi:hypothetical protein